MTELYLGEKVKQPWPISLEQLGFMLLGAARSAHNDEGGGFVRDYDFGPRVDYQGRGGRMYRRGRASAWYHYDAEGNFVRRETVRNLAIGKTKKADLRTRFF